MEQQSNKFDWRRIIAPGVVILIAIIGSFWSDQRADYVEKNGVWTIMTIDRVHAAHRGTSFRCHYKFMGQVYKNTGSLVNYSDEGKRFFLQVIPTDPERVLYHTEQRIPSWFTLEAPPEGWKTRPTEAELAEWQTKADSVAGRKSNIKLSGTDNQDKDERWKLFVVGGILFLVWLVYAFWKDYKRSYLQTYGVWTILTIDKVYAANRSMAFECHYPYMGKVYKNLGKDYDETISFNDKGKRLFLQVIPSKPMKALFYSDEFVPSWFTLEAPPKGWKSRPTEDDLRKWQEEADSVGG